MVIAIGGMIFAIIFAAFPRVQISRRDGERKNELASFAGQLEFYQSSNRGRYPSSQVEVQDVIDGMNTDFEDPSSGATYTVTYVSNLTNPVGPGATAGNISYADGARCSTNNDQIESSGFNRTYAVVMRLERGIHCIDI